MKGVSLSGVRIDTPIEEWRALAVELDKLSRRMPGLETTQKAAAEFLRLADAFERARLAAVAATLGGDECQCPDCTALRATRLSTHRRDLN